MHPADNELEVSVFGRGFGEAVVVHLGGRAWVLVDSLLDTDGQPSTLKYLERIGVDIERDIRLIVVTHWHDDHAAGISDLYKKAKSAHLSLPIVINDPRMAAFCGMISANGSGRISSGVKELGQISAEQRDHCRAPLKLSACNQVLLRIAAENMPHNQETCVEAISPSNGDVQAFLKRLATLPPLVPGVRAEPFQENDIAVALWISIGSQKILLGADLEVCGSGRGWDAVLNSSAPLVGKASIFKIPHHGSANGDHPQVWSQIVAPEPTVALTTYNRGQKLPTDNDVARILTKTQKAYVTSRLQRRSTDHLAAVNKACAELGIKLQQRPRLTGQIRMRMKLPDDAGWSCELFDGARHISKLGE